jgi:hypothetical protein
MILYSHRIDEKNPGDLYSTPKEYFLLDRYYQTCDVFKSDEVLSADFKAHVTGGGDILVSEKWLNHNRKITQWANAPLNIVWGAGVNLSDNNIVGQLKDHYKFIGTRTYSTDYPSAKFEFVPCVSVMHELLDEEQEVKYETTIIRHFKRPIKGLPAVLPGKEIKNKPNDIETLIRTINQSETIITNSYHATYWAMLLNKNVHCFIEKDDCKLSTFKHKPHYFKEDSFNLNKPKIDYSDMKGEYRELNNKFYNKVRDEYSSRNNT